MWCCVAEWVVSKVLRIVAPFKVKQSKKNEEAATLKCTTHLITVSHPVRLESSAKPLWWPKISQLEKYWMNFYEYCRILWKICLSLQFSDQAILMTTLHLLFFMIEHIYPSWNKLTCNICLNQSNYYPAGLCWCVFTPKCSHPWNELLL